MNVNLNDLRCLRSGRELFRVDHLALASHGITAIVGENGSGKSSLLRILAGLSSEFSGEIHYDGVPHREYFARGNHPSRLVLLPQHPALFRRNVLANAALAGPGAGLSREQARTRARVVLDELGVGRLASRPAHRLSGGESRLVALARALVPDPELLLLDEPLAGIDPENQARVEGFLQRRGAEAQRAVLFTAHREEEAWKLAHQLFRLVEGRLVEVHPQNVFRGDFFCREGIGFFRTGDAEIEIPEGMKPSTLVHIPPAEIVLQVCDAPSSARNRLEGRVRTIALVGSNAEVTLDCGIPLVALVSLRSLREQGWGVGDRLVARFKVNAVRRL